MNRSQRGDYGNDKTGHWLGHRILHDRMRLA